VRSLPLLILMLLSVAILPACHTLAPQPIVPWPEHRTSLQALGQFAFRGQIAAATATEGFSATLRWQQRGDTVDAQLRAPLGVGGAHIRLDRDGLQLTGSDAMPLAGEAARAALAQLLGFEPPLVSLHYWLLGVPDPAAPTQEETLDGQQRLVRLRQLDWQAEYGGYVRAGAFWLPGSVTLQRGALRLKLRIAQWELS
jgi:outer membrane lipoprotein LolB